ncbi:Iron-sulfur cluster assembly 2-like protein, mitochondrial [Stagonosporopsis vannaccii]|nr:Iron-sulfur cluster assembly 2-like protein, mitochondrial [Stagonosporopsis vannaccii]
MGSPSTMCTSCLRAARRVAAHSARPASTTHASMRAYSRAAATSQLFLDFLAPSALPRAAKQASAFSKSIRVASVLQPSRRSLATTTTTTTTTTDPSAATPARAVLHPRTDDSGAPLGISISPRASHRLSSIAQKDANPNSALRVSIESGGCHGFQYLMSLTDLAKEPPTDEDTVFEGVKGEKVVVDESSLELLNGSTVDYTMELIGSQFKVTGIPGATSSCGCGTSFDIKLD